MVFTHKLSLILLGTSSLMSVYAIELEPINIIGEKEKAGIIKVDAAKEIDTKDLGEKLFNSVMLNQTSLPTKSSMISIRGNNFKATEYYEDGIPLYQGVHGFTDSSMYRANEADIYINTGGAQGIYGASGTGGEINLNSKKLKSGFSTAIKGTTSTNDNLVNLTASNKSDKWYVKFALNAYKQDNYNLSKSFETTPLQMNENRINSDIEQFDGSVKLGVDLNANSKLAFKFSHLQSDYGVPVQVYDEPSNPFGSNADYTRINDKVLTSYWLFYDYESSDVEYLIRAYYDKYEDIYDFYTSPDFSTLLFPSSQYDDSRLGAIVSMNYNYTPAQSGKLTLQVGQNIHKQHIDGNSETREYEMMNYSLSYLHEYALSQALMLRGSLEYKNQMSIEAYQFGEEETQYGDNSGINAQLTATYKINENQNYYASLAHKNRFASLGEIYQVFPWQSVNTDIKPEVSNSVEVGTNLKVLKDSVIDVSLFYNNVNDMIIYADNSYQNIDEANLQGLEFHLHNYSFESHDLELSYAYIDAKDDNDEKILQTPTHKLFIQDAIEINSKSSFTASYLYVGKRDDIYNSTRYTLDAYSLVDAQVTYTPTKSLDIKAGVKNLLDENWEYSHGFFAKGRTLFASLEYRY